MENENYENNENNNKPSKAIPGFVLGLCSTIAWFIPLFGYPVTILGIIFSAMGLKSEKKVFAIIGLILSIVFLVVTLMNSIAGVVLYSDLNL